MMAKKKKNWWKSNILFYGCLAILLFTPLGFHFKVLVSNIISFSPSLESEEDQLKIEHYRWTLEDFKGRKVDFNSSKGKVVIVNFWATWCPPCIAELPELNELYQHFKSNEHIDFYFITNQEKSIVTKLLNEKGISIPNYFSISSPPKELQSNKLPTTFVLDKQGKIKIHKTGAANWSSQSTIALLENMIK